MVTWALVRENTAITLWKTLGRHKEEEVILSMILSDPLCCAQSYNFALATKGINKSDGIWLNTVLS